MPENKDPIVNVSFSYPTKDNPTTEDQPPIEDTRHYDVYNQKEVPPVPTEESKQVIMNDFEFLKSFLLFRDGEFDKWEEDDINMFLKEHHKKCREGIYIMKDSPQDDAIKLMESMGQFKNDLNSV